MTASFFPTYTLHWGAFATIIALLTLLAVLVVGLWWQQRRYTTDARTVELLNARIDAANAQRELMDLTRDAYIGMAEATLEHQRPNRTTPGRADTAASVVGDPLAGRWS